MVVAAVLLAIGAVAALGCISSATRGAARAKEYSTAAILAQKKFGDLETDTTQIQVGEQSGDFGDLYPGWSFDQSVENSDLNGAVRVTIVVHWPGNGNAQFISYEQNPNATAPTDNSPSSGASTGTGTGGGGARP